MEKLTRTGEMSPQERLRLAEVELVEASVAVLRDYMDDQHSRRMGDNSTALKAAKYVEGAIVERMSSQMEDIFNTKEEG